MTKPKRIAIVIPAYNEGQVINKVISDITKKLQAKKYNFAIIVVDDSSKDDTATQSKAAGATVVSHILNMGSGGATATGLSYAQQNGFEVAATVDADGQHNPKDLMKGLEKIQNSDVDLLIGSRLIDSKGMSKTKVVGNKGLSIFTNILFGVKSTDSQSGLRLFSKKALDELKWKSSGYEFCSEMLWRAKQCGLKIDEYPISAVYTDYSMSKGQNNWNSINIIKSLLYRRVMELFGE